MVRATTGTWRINYRSLQGEELEDLVHSLVWARSAATPDVSGQWLADLNPGNHGGQIPALLRAVACRLGLLPVHLAPDYLEVLGAPNALCIVADTNSIYHGALYQALRLRLGKPTTVIVPDQVFMELQRRRGREPSGNKVMKLSERAVQSARYALPLVGTRVLQRIRSELKIVIHHARPPDAMVRYFGSDAGDRGEEEAAGLVDSAGPSFQRDRLILEVVRHTPSLLPPGVPVWLATGDADLASQAASEGFNVGFSWVPKEPGRFSLASPHIDARTGSAHFVEWPTFVEEFIWNLGCISLQRSGEATKTELRLPESRDRVLGEHGRPWPVESARQIAAPRWIGEVAVPQDARERSVSPVDLPGGLRGAPRKAPAAQSLVKFLLASAGGQGVPVDTVFEPVRPYLTALGWAAVANGHYIATVRGRQLVEGWSGLKRDSVESHTRWLKDAAGDLQKLSVLSAFQAQLAGRKGVEAADLAMALGISESNVHSQGRLLSAFGAIVRIGKTHWGIARDDRAKAKLAVVSALGRLRADAGLVAGVARTDALFRSILEASPVSLPDFRVALWDLFNEGKVRVSGSVPPADKSETIQMELLVPGDGGEPEVEEVDLGAGDFLIPGESSQAVQMQEVS